MRKIRLRFKTKEGVEKYNKRFHKGEVAQAHIQHNLGYREFKCRGNEPCENEMNLFSTAYNLIKIYKKWKERGEGFEVSIKKYFLLVIYYFFKKNYNTAWWDPRTLGSSPQNLIIADVRGATNYVFWGAFNWIFFG